MSRLRSERGAVTAELAVALPVLLALTIGLVWLLALAATQVRVIDAAREGARVLARGDSDADAAQVTRRIAPPGAELRVTRGDGRVTVTVTAPVDGPGGLFDAWEGVELSSSAVAVEEGSR